MQPGDRVMVPGTLCMSGIGIEDDESLIELDGNTGFAVAKTDNIVISGTQQLAVVPRDDLREALTGNLRESARKRLQNALNDPGFSHPYPPEPGDVWSDHEGVLWFARQCDGGLHLVCDRSGVTATPESAGKMRLEWRREQ